MNEKSTPGARVASASPRKLKRIFRGLLVYRGSSTARAELIMAVCAFTGFLVIWYAIVAFGIVPERFLPFPDAVVKALWGMFVNNNFIEDMGISVAEIVASRSGIGHVIWSMRRFLKTPEIMAGILTVGILGLATDQVIRILARRWFRYL